MTELLQTWGNLILSAALVAVTIKYVMITSRMLNANRQAVNAMEKQNYALTRPYVLVDAFANPGEAYFRLRVRNLGTTAATKLRLSLDRPFFQDGLADEAHDISKYRAFTEAIPSFGPKAELVFNLGRVFAPQSDEQVTPLTFGVTAIYDYSGTTITERNVIDLATYSKTALNPDLTIQQLKEICNVLDGIKDSLTRGRR